MLKPWAKASALPALRFGGDVLVVDRLLLGVGRRIMITSASAAASATDITLQPGCLGLGLRRRALAQADAHVDAGVLQVQRVGMALRAVADDGDLAAADDRAVGVLLVVHVGAMSASLSCGWGTARSRAWCVRAWAARPARCAAARRCRRAASSSSKSSSLSGWPSRLTVSAVVGRRRGSCPRTC